MFAICLEHFSDALAAAVWSSLIFALKRRNADVCDKLNKYAYLFAVDEDGMPLVIEVRKREEQ